MLACDAPRTILHRTKAILDSCAWTGGVSRRMCEEMVILQWSMVSCHFRMRLRRGIFKKILREAQPPVTTDN
jgi:hypothetical protein